jgi:DNA-binding LacI/PurR family transcriptional regulator
MNRRPPIRDVATAVGVSVTTVSHALNDKGRVDASTRERVRTTADRLAYAGGAERIALLVAGGGRGWAEETIAAYVAWSSEHGREPLIEATGMRSSEQAGQAVRPGPLRSGYEAAARLLEHARPDAIVSLAERYTSGVLAAATERGLRIPHDLRVAAAVDGHQARDADVTAIDLRPRAQGEAAIALVLERLAGERREQPLITAAQLRLRGST